MALPRIYSVSPEHGTTSAPLQPTITVVWSEALDPASVRPEQLYLTNMATRDVIGVTGIAVVGRELQFTPDAPLVPATTYTVTIAPGQMGLSGAYTQTPYLWIFTTTISDLPTAPVITTPADGTRVDTGTITWTAITGAEQYRVHLATDRLFETLGLELTPTATTITLANDLAQGSYFLRVRAEAGPDISPWSPTVAFAYKTYRDDGGPTYGELWLPPAEEFVLMSASPTSGSCGETPSAVALTFSQPLAATCATTAAPVWSPMPLFGAASTRPTGTWALSDDAYTLTFTGTFAANTLYAVRFPATFRAASGEALLDPEYSFTTAYTVLFAHPSQLRAQLGTLVSDVSDATLYYQLFLASVTVNRRERTSTTVADALVPLSDSLLTPALVDETLLRAKIGVLTTLMAEYAARGHEQKVLGDFTYDLDYNQTLEQLQKALSDAEADLSGLSAMASSVYAETLLPSAWESSGPTMPTRSTF